MEEVVGYAKEKEVEIIMHHETSSAPVTYEQQMDTAYQLMQKLGIHAVKSGYVGKIIPKGEYHHGQWMVNHYQKAVEKATTEYQKYQTKTDKSGQYASGIQEPFAQTTTHLRATFTGGVYQTE